MVSINYLAVLVAAIVSFALGWIWYGPLFGNMWKGLMGFTDESMKNMKLSPTQAIAGGFVSSLVTAYVLAHFVGLLNVEGFQGACVLASWIWLGFLATNALGSYLWEGKPFKLFVLNAVEQLVAIHLMALVLVFWK
jgi:hypothetical protein